MNEKIKDLMNQMKVLQMTLNELQKDAEKKVEDIQDLTIKTDMQNYLLKAKAGKLDINQFLSEIQKKYK